MQFVFFSSLLYGYSYFHIFNMSNTARRIHILILKYRNPKATLSEQYKTDTLIGLRIERLRSIGILYGTEEKLCIRGGVPLAIAYGMRYFRKLFY
jgi:hypothetical protein